MPKHEYEIIVEYTEKFRVFVEAENEDAAKELALDRFVRTREAEEHHTAIDDPVELDEWNLEAKVNWSDAED